MALGSPLLDSPYSQLTNITLELENVGLDIGNHQILSGVSARFESGKVTALLGPSGAGKTSLLELLCGHAGSSWGTKSGVITANGAALSGGLFRRLGALVPQADVLLPGLTVRQTLTFGALLKCRAPADPGAGGGGWENGGGGSGGGGKQGGSGLAARPRSLKEFRARRVEELLVLLGLTSCADVLVGGEHLRGVSGGQRKRTSIALELLADPPLLFLDEPTSGLDSKMAEDVTRLLGRLAKGGTEEAPGALVEEEEAGPSRGVSSGGAARVVVCTVHQPSLAIFQGFDQVVLLARPLVDDPSSPGVVVWQGRSAELLGFVESRGLPAPLHENPADHAMRLLQDQASLDALLEPPRSSAPQAPAFEVSALEGSAYPSAPRSPPSGGPPSGGPPSGWASPPRAQSFGGGPAEAESFLWRLVEARRSFALGPLAQFWVLLRRFLVDYFRDPKKFLSGLLVRVAIGVILGVVWNGQAGDTQESIFPVQGALFACCMNGVMDTVFQTALLLPGIKPLLLREYRNGSYGLVPCELALFSCHALAQTVNIAALAGPVYTLVGLRAGADKFGIFLAALSALVWLGVAVGLAVGGVADTFQDAQGLVVPLLVPLIFFSGYLIPYAQIPWYFKWLYEVSFFQHAIAILEINQFAGAEFTDCPPRWRPWTDDTARPFPEGWPHPDSPPEKLLEPGAFSQEGLGLDTGRLGFSGFSGFSGLGFGGADATWSCAQLASGALNLTAKLGLEPLGPGGVLDLCADTGSICHATGEDLLKSLHVDPSALALKFEILGLYIAAALLLAYLALARALEAPICPKSPTLCKPGSPTEKGSNSGFNSGKRRAGRSTEK